MSVQNSSQPDHVLGWTSPSALVKTALNEGRSAVQPSKRSDHPALKKLQLNLTERPACTVEINVLLLLGSFVDIDF